MTRCSSRPAASHAANSSGRRSGICLRTLSPCRVAQGRSRAGCDACARLELECAAVVEISPLPARTLSIGSAAALNSPGVDVRDDIVEQSPDYVQTARRCRRAEHAMLNSSGASNKRRNGAPNEVCTSDSHARPGERCVTWAEDGGQ